MVRIKFITISVLFLCSLFFLLNCTSKTSRPKIKLGIDVLLSDQTDLIKNKRVGVITNQTGVDSKGNHIIDLLYQAPEVKLVALFGPEHGIRGDVEGGYEIKDRVDSKTGVPIISIYGKTKKPTAEMLKNIDVLIFDIQDVGTRFYTYISTMSLAMKQPLKMIFNSLCSTDPIQ